MAHYSLNARVDPGGSRYACYYNFTTIEDIKKYLCYDLVFGGGIYHFAWYGISYVLHYESIEIDLTPYIHCIFNDTLTICYEDSSPIYYHTTSGKKIDLEGDDYYRLKEIISSKMIHFFGSSRHEICGEENGHIFNRRVKGGYFIGRDFKNSVIDTEFDLKHYVSKDFDRISFHKNNEPILVDFKKDDNLVKMSEENWKNMEEIDDLKYQFFVDWKKVIFPALKGKLLSPTDRNYGIVESES